jgi:hypothetical protein
LVTSIFAQAPQAFNYQGVARDLSGNPISNQNINLQITILQGSASGTEAYKETHNITTSDLGLFSLQIGMGTLVNGDFENIDWGSEKHFLLIEMDENGDNNYQLIGTSQLWSVPYALYAENGSEWNTNNSGINYSNGNVGIGSNTPTGKLMIQTEGENYNINTDSNFQNKIAPLIITQTGNGVSSDGRSIMIDANQIEQAKEDAGLYINNNSSSTLILNRGGGNVGIGDNIYPKSKLHVTDGDVYIDNSNRGVIMKSPDGQCWRMTVNNSGQPEFNSITCPD